MFNFCPANIKLTCIASAILLTSGCIERSTVVKVRKDGSGVVHIRNHEQNVEIKIGGKTTKKESDSEKKIPSPELIQKMVAAMGQGVTLMSATATTNRSGWEGYELVFAFDDVNQLVIPDKMTAPGNDSKKDNESAASATDSDAANEATDGVKERAVEIKQGYRFSMKNGELKIHSIEKEQPVTETEVPKPVGTIDPFADEPPSSAAAVTLGAPMTQLYAKMMADMRVGVFVEIEGEIESTNAIHRQENLITLVRVDVGKMLESPGAEARFKELGKIKDSSNRRARMQLISNEVEGFDVDAQDPIVVRMK